MSPRLLYIIAFLSFTLSVSAQVLHESSGLVATYGSGDYAPMWHNANSQGVNSMKNSSVYVRLGVGGEHPFFNDNLELDWGVDAVGGYNVTSNVFVQQAFLDVRWKRIKLSFGQKERWCDMKNPRLSTGALVESGNARPLPQIRFELPEYWDIPGLKGWLAIRGHLAYGWFTDGCWQKSYFAETSARTKGVLYHSKAGFARIGNESKFPLTAEIGLHMTTMFGGELYNSMNKSGMNSKNPTRIKDYFLALIPLSGDEQYSGFDQGNVAGNVLGSWLGAITWNDKNWKLHFYYDHVFEDHSQLFWEYGLWTEQLAGIELELKKFEWVRNVVFEYFNLKNQSGPIYHDSNSKIPDQISCVDNNYNHQRYAGWFNYGRIIGTPLCTSPVYNEDKLQICRNNRVEAFHFGVEGGLLRWLDYRMLFTYSNNWGTYAKPFVDIKKNVSGLVEFTFIPSKKRNWSIGTSFAFDKGELYGDNYGAMVTLKRMGVYNLKKKAGK